MSLFWLEVSMRFAASSLGVVMILGLRVYSLPALDVVLPDCDGHFRRLFKDRIMLLMLEIMLLKSLP